MPEEKQPVNVERAARGAREAEQAATALAAQRYRMAGKAPLANVGLTISALQGAMTRPAHLPGIVVLYGPSGLGKSTAAAVAAMQLSAYYVQAKSSWTRKAVYQSILKVMGVAAAKTVYDMEDQVAAQLAASGKPLIVDECDHLVQKSSIEIIRDIYEASGAAILLIGEEHLPAGLARWERIHNRVLEWVPAQYATMTDARALRELYCDKVAVEDDLLTQIHQVSKGVARRICVNLERAQQVALGLGKKSMNLGEWGKRPLYTGEAPVRGRA